MDNVIFETPVHMDKYMDKYVELSSASALLFVEGFVL